MHAEAEGGTASHSLYKGSLENPEEASLFRSKMTPNILSPAHRQLPSKAKTSKGAAAAATWPSDGASPSVTENAASASVSSLDAKIGEPGAADGERLTPASEFKNANRSPEP